MGKRMGLQPQTKLIIQHKEYTIIKECGRGMSCIVYQGQYLDSLNYPHDVFIKELHPYRLQLKRDINQHLIIEKYQEKSYQKILKQFLQTYQHHMTLQSNPHMKNDSSQVFEYGTENNTHYMIIDQKAGINYQKYQEKTLYDVLCNIKSLCYIIQSYHQQQYLHLDIKPSNIMILNEQQHQLLLFDYDSFYQMNQKETPTFFYSEGYSPLEVRLQHQKELGPWSDLYAIGCILFERLFQHTPTHLDCKDNATYHYSTMNYQSPNYSPKLYSLFNTFFHRCLSPSIYQRYQNVEEIITILDEMIECSDLTKHHLLSTYVIHQPCFIGRKREYKQLQELLQQEHHVFIQGVGGIGKSELMKYYAKHSKKYHTILYLYIHQSIFESFISDDLMVHQLNQAEEEDNESYYQRKYQIVKELVDDNTLLLIDNFDQENDPHLQDILQLSCDIIITSRYYHHDYNYAEISLPPFHLEESMQLFQYYHKKEYPKEEWNHIEDCIELLQYHPMSISLLAKALRYEDNIVAFKEKLFSIHGSISINQEKIAHRKDDRCMYDSMSQHIQSLFMMHSFSNDELEMMVSLALLGSLEIRYSLWMEWMHCDITTIEHLIDCGWILQNNDKIYLHQLVLDVVYHTYHHLPCETIHQSLYEYAKQKLEHRYQEKIRLQILLQLIQRSASQSITMQHIYMEVLHYHKDETLANHLLEMVSNYDMKMKAYQIHADVLSHQFTWDEDHSSLIKQIIDDYRHSVSYILQSQSGYPLCQSLISIAKKIKQCGDNYYNESYDEILVQDIYDYFILIIERIDVFLQELSIDEQKEGYHTLLQILEDNYIDLYFCEHYPRDDFILTWKERIDFFSDCELDFSMDFDEEIDLDDFQKTYEDFGDEAYDEGNYELAITYYEKSIQYENNALFIMDRLIACYEALARYEDCYNLCMKQKENFDFVNYDDRFAYYAFMLENFEEANMHCEHYVLASQEAYEEEPSQEHLQAYIHALMWLSKYHSNPQKKNEVLSICENLEKHRPDAFVVCDDLLLYYQHKISLLLSNKKYDDAFKYIILCMFKDSNKDIYDSYLLQIPHYGIVLSYLLKAYFLQDYMKYEESISYAKEGYALALSLHHDILLSFASHIYGCSFDMDYDRKQSYCCKCNYLSLGQWMIHYFDCSLDTQRKIYEDVIQAYRYIDAYQKAVEVYDELYRIYNLLCVDCSTIIHAMLQQLELYVYIDMKKAIQHAYDCENYILQHDLSRNEKIDTYFDLCRFYADHHLNRLTICACAGLCIVQNINWQNEDDCLQKILSFTKCESIDLDTSLRFLQYLNQSPDENLKVHANHLLQYHQESDISFTHKKSD